MVSVTDKWLGRVHHAQLLQAALALLYLGRNRWQLYRLWCWPADAERPVYFALYPKRGGCFGIRRTLRTHFEFQRALPKNVFHLVSGRYQRGWPRSMRRLHRHPLTQVTTSLIPLWLSRTGLQIQRLRCRYQIWYPPINKLCDPILCRVRFSNFCHHRLPCQTRSQWEQLGW